MNNKLTLLKIGEEIFAMQSAHLTKKQIICIESLVESLSTDYKYEIEDMDSYSICSLIINIVKNEFDVTFESIGIDYEFKVRIN